MRFRDSKIDMFAEALELLLGVERRHHQIFAVFSGQPVPCWEPSADVYVRGDEISLVVALPGVEADQINVSLEGNRLIISGQRRTPVALSSSAIHRLEIPYGRFERRITLPSGQFELLDRYLENGCLVLVTRQLRG